MLTLAAMGATRKVLKPAPTMAVAVSAAHSAMCMTRVPESRHHPAVLPPHRAMTWWRAALSLSLRALQEARWLWQGYHKSRQHAAQVAALWKTKMSRQQASTPLSCNKTCWRVCLPSYLLEIWQHAASSAASGGMQQAVKVSGFICSRSTRGAALRSAAIPHFRQAPHCKVRTSHCYCQHNAHNTRHNTEAKYSVRVSNPDVRMLATCRLWHAKKCARALQQHTRSGTPKLGSYMKAGAQGATAKQCTMRMEATSSALLSWGQTWWSVAAGITPLD
jgi:hypothetical protein